LVDVPEQLAAQATMSSEWHSGNNDASPEKFVQHGHDNTTTNCTKGETNSWMAVDLGL
jgi:hypothetical protein